MGIRDKRGKAMKTGDLVRLKDDSTGFWGLGILVVYYEQFSGWMVQWPKNGDAGRSFHCSHNLEVIK